MYILTACRASSVSTPQPVPPEPPRDALLHRESQKGCRKRRIHTRPERCRESWLALLGLPSLLYSRHRRFHIALASPMPSLVSHPIGASTASTALTRIDRTTQSAGAAVVENSAARETQANLKLLR